MEKLLNRRFGTLYPTIFATFRKEKDESPSKTWAITKDVTLTEVKGGEYHLRNSGTSTLWAVARGAYEKVQMWGFTITWSSLVSDKLSLAFETEELAKKWHTAFTQCIETASAKHSGSFTSSLSPTMDIGARSKASTQEEVTEIRGHMDDSQSSSRSWASLLHINGISGRLFVVVLVWLLSPFGYYYFCLLVGF